MNPETSSEQIMTPANMLILGLPGSGKTALGELMAEIDPNLEYISLGDISRNLSPEDPRRKYIDNLYLEHNKPVGDPDFFVELVRPAVRDAKTKGKGIILDGVPVKLDEVDPLNAMLEQEGVKIDGVVVCEVNPFKAMQRVMSRGTRENGLDNFETAMNRGDVYLRVIDKLKGRLGGFLGVKIVSVDTENIDVKSTLDSANKALREIRLKEASANVIDIQANEVTLDNVELQELHHAFEKNDTVQSMRLLSELFISEQSRELIDKILANAGESDPKQTVCEYLKNHPDFMNLPLAASRYAEMIVGNVYEPLKHLAKVIPEEARLRSEGTLDIDALRNILRETLVTKEIIHQYQAKANEIKHADEFVTEEFDARKADLDYIEAYLRDAGAITNGATIRSLMQIQPKYWNIFTSSLLVGSVDGNYQKRINSTPGSHHSLSVPVDMPRKMIANSMGEYRPFIEAVSTSERSGFDTSLGFLHVVGVDESGKAFQVEWPLLMHDARLALHPNPLLRDMLARGQEIYFNHDFWHNIVPVYAESFNLYHPHAPIAYGGILPNYLEFGRALREEKEEYEIFVAKCHAEAQQYRIKHDPDYKRSQIDAALTILGDIPHLRQQLAKSDDAEFANNASQYFMTVTLGRLLNVFPPDSPDLEPIIKKLNEDKSLEQSVSTQDVLKLLLTQRTVLATKESRLEFMHDLYADSSVNEELREKIINRLLPSVNSIEREPALSGELFQEIREHENVVSLAMKYIDPKNSYAESGAKELHEALKAIGLDGILNGSEQNTTLQGLDLLRWLAIIAPQRDPLKGHMEKVHGKSKIIFGEKKLAAPEIVKRQTEAIKRDKDVYEYRTWAREFGQTLALDIYNVLFNDAQKVLKDPRMTLFILSRHDTVAPDQKRIIAQGMNSLDLMLEDLVNASYSLSPAQIQDIEKLANTSGVYSAELKTTLHDIAKRYILLQHQESAYQKFADVNYADSKSEIENSTMNLLDIDSKK